MYRVFAHLPGEPAIAADLLTPCDRDALVSHYREGTQDADQQAWLSRLFRRREWIACDCRADANAPPLMFVRRIDSAQYVLARMTDRPPHARHCPFASHPALMNARDERPPLPALAALLFRWITAARLNVLYPYEADDVLQAQYLSLREVSKSLMLTPGRRLFDFSRTHPKGLPTLYRRLRHASATERRDGPCFGARRARSLGRPVSRCSRGPPGSRDRRTPPPRPRSCRARPSRWTSPPRSVDRSWRRMRP